MTSKLSAYWKGIILGTLVSCLFLYSLISNITKPLSLSHGDAFLVNFILKHWMTVITTFQFWRLPTLPMFYGFTNSLFFTDHHFIQAVFALPFYLLTQDIITTSNLVVVFSMIGSVWAMYLFLFYLTKNTVSSILGSIVFVFNPTVIARFPDQLILLTLMFIPLIFLFFEKALKENKSSNTFLFFLFLSFQLLSSLYYSVFLTAILPFYLIGRLWQEKISPVRLLNRGVFYGLFIFGLVVFISSYFYKQTFDKYPIRRSVDQSAIFSAWPSDYLFTSPSNTLYGGLKAQAAKALPLFVRMGIDSEQNLFPGVTLLFLFILGFLVFRKSKKDKIWSLCLFLLLLSLLLSLGPKIHLSSSLKIPGPYQFFYLINPLFGFLRTPARFGVFFFFFLSIISSLTVLEILKRLSHKKSGFIGIVLIAFIILEYWNKPLEFTSIDTNTYQFYSTLNNQKHIKVILDYPIGNRIPYPLKEARAEDLDARYMLWATILHNKTLFNGYTGFLPSQYYRRAGLVSLNFPTLEKIKQLQKWGVDAIILHKDELNDPADFTQIKKGLILLNVKLLTETENLAFFDLNTWIE